MWSNYLSIPFLLCPKLMKNCLLSYKLKLVGRKWKKMKKVYRKSPSFFPFYTHPGNEDNFNHWIYNCHWKPQADKWQGMLHRLICLKRMLMKCVIDVGSHFSNNCFRNLIGRFIFMYLLKKCEQDKWGWF